MINSFEKRLASDMLISPVLGGYYYAVEYQVLVARHPDQEQLETWQRGVFDTTLHQQLFDWKNSKARGPG
ncbi:MAG: hypothetical protein V3U36_06435 [Anaerolineales bacterium]